MHGLPATFDTAFLLNRTLEEICFTENQILLLFDMDVQITLEGAYSHSERGTESEPLHVPASTSKLMQLAGHTIVRAASTADGTLSMFFDNGHRLTCLDTPQYESYRVRHRSQEIIV